MLGTINVIKRNIEGVEERKGRTGTELEARKFSLRTIPHQRGAAEQDELGPPLTYRLEWGGRETKNLGLNMTLSAVLLWLQH